MEYIINIDSEEIDFSRYLTYLRSMRNFFPAHVYSFASNPNNFDLCSRESLHDAWLESLTVKEVAIGVRNEKRSLEVSLCLLGPFHDRRIRLEYSGVTEYSFRLPARHGESRCEHMVHGDLYTHEVRVGHEGLLVHELLFDSGSTLLIECADFKHSEELIDG